jgi:hypothetical protein
MQEHKQVLWFLYACMMRSTWLQIAQTDKIPAQVAAAAAAQA